MRCLILVKKISFKFAALTETAIRAPEPNNAHEDVGVPADRTQRERACTGRLLTWKGRLVAAYSSALRLQIQLLT